MTASAPIRRVTLVSPYALSVFGGVQEQVLSMSRELTNRNLSVQVIAPDASDTTSYDTPARVARFGSVIKVSANGSRAPLTLSSQASVQAYHAIRLFEPDVVHFHEPFAPRVGLRSLRAHRAPAVATFHRSGQGPAVSLAAPLLRRWSHHLDESAAVSIHAAHTAMESCGLRTKVLFNGFETQRFVEFPRESQTLITVLVVGRLENRKGVATAVATVRAHNVRDASPWQLVILGDGPQRAQLESLASGDPMVRFLGALSDDEKRRWYRRADVLVAPATHGESFGLILLEAMASETTVVASDIPGYHDAAGDHAILFSPSDSEDLERAITRALARRHPDRQARARRYAEQWSMHRLVGEYLELYERARQHFSSLK